MTILYSLLGLEEVLLPKLLLLEKKLPGDSELRRRKPSPSTGLQTRYWGVYRIFLLGLLKYISFFQGGGASSTRWVPENHIEIIDFTIYGFYASDWIIAWSHLYPFDDKNLLTNYEFYSTFLFINFF